MQNVSASIDQKRVTVQRHTGDLDTFRAKAALERSAIQWRDTFSKRATAEEIGRINRTIH